ncbi:hypothetical protein Ct9H90mP29_16890 [bacterium]|nr:MAG: hypothetical protein Ct9H90mP29_16890 [bacterium]
MINVHKNHLLQRNLDEYTKREVADPNLEQNISLLLEM